MDYKEFQDLEEYVDASVSFIADVVESTPSICNIGLAGGNTPRPIYAALATREDIDLEDTHFYMTDERYVPYDHADSNYNMVMRTLGVREGVHVHDFDTSLPAEQALESYEHVLRNIQNEALDLTIVGIGLDGHIASLAPRTSVLQEKSRWVGSVHAPTLTVPDRLTMTLPYIRQSKRVLMLVAGNEKRQVLDILCGDHRQSVEDFPAMVLLDHASFTIHYLAT